MADGSADATQQPWQRLYPSDIDWAADLPPRPLYALLDDAAARFGTRPCLDFLDRHYSYREVADLTNRMARGLQDLGVGKGVRVGLFLPNTPCFVIAYYAILKTGATVVNYNPLYAERDVAAQVADSGTSVMVTLDLALLYKKLAPLLGKTTLTHLIVCRMADMLPLARKLLFPIVKWREIATIPTDDHHISFSRLIHNRALPDPVTIDPERDVAVLQYTGGTTGVPKGAMLTHANLYLNAVQCGMWVHQAEPGHERVLGVLPFFHVFAMTVVMNLAIRLGAEIVLLPRFDLIQVIRTIDAKKPTLFPAVPTIYMAIANHRERVNFDLSSIKYCISGGAPLPVEVKQAFESCTGCTLVEGYGLTEASPVVACNPLTGINKAGSIGLPFPGTTIEIISLDDGITPLPIGERGELCVRGPQVMAGYWNQPEETARDLRDGRLHTGDVATMDADGYIHIVDRIKDLILCGGHNVYPRHVEEAIYLHPAVAECVVLGLPDPYRGQSVKAFVKLAEGAALTQEQLLEFLKDKLSPVQRPRAIEFRAELPRTMIGKLSRKDLLEEERRKRDGKAA